MIMDVHVSQFYRNSRIYMRKENNYHNWSINDGDYVREVTDELDFQDIKERESKKKKIYYITLVVLTLIMEIIILNFISKM